MLKNISLDLTEGPIYKHLKRIAIPASIGFLFNTLFNVVDTIYVGQISTDALAGLTLSFPVYFILISIALGLGQGTTALTSIHLGEKRIDAYHQKVKASFFWAFIFSVFMALLAPVLIPFLFRLMGASGASLQLGIDYSVVIYAGSFFFFTNLLVSGILNAEGNTKPFRNFIIVGFFLNLILDPLFIFGWFGLPELSTVGVALGTVVVQGLGSFYLLWMLKSSSHFSYKALFKTKLSVPDIIQVFAQAAPVALTNATIAIGIFVINYYALLYGGDVAVAAYGSALRIEQILFLPTIGFNIAALSIIGQNFGAKKASRMKEAAFKASYIGLGILTVAIVLIWLFAGPLMRLFSKDAILIQTGVSYLRIATIGLWSYILLNISVSMLQAIKKPLISFMIGLYRQLFPIVVFAYLGGTLGFGVSGIWWGIVLVNWSAAFIAMPITFYLFKKATQHFDNPPLLG